MDELLKQLSLERDARNLVNQSKMLAQPSIQAVPVTVSGRNQDTGQMKAIAPNGKELELSDLTKEGTSIGSSGPIGIIGNGSNTLEG